MKFRMNIIGLAAFVLLAASGCSPSSDPLTDSFSYEAEDLELLVNLSTQALTCKKATAAEIQVVNQGNLKKQEFLDQCAQVTGGSAWCSQLIRPNPDSVSIFRCTYGSTQVHQLIHPDTGTWKNAFTAVQLIQELEQKGLRVCKIYNWWRPEPYNKNVSGAAGRHPYATSIDVRFCSNSDADRGFEELCKQRKLGRIRAIGHYGSSALHFGVGDATANTWGRSCP